MGVPQFKEIRRAYGFDEVAIAPGSVTINPEMTNTDFSVDGITLSTPILGSAMDAVASPKFASTMDGLGGMAVMNLEGVQTRYNNPDDMLDEIVEASEESVTGILQKVYSAPIREELVGERVQEIK
ncbi:MAG TPA: GuaB3 family IMP dehydrogenase-related protein, partial [Dehalococcoidia bacterium]|nr:GuaB3 family IMP dehydrogenase-related protein [Dehalococcoidia bacterium]